MNPTRAVNWVALVPTASLAVVGAAVGIGLHSAVVFAGAMWASAAVAQDAYRHLLMAQGKYRRLLAIDAIGAIAASTGIVLAATSSEIALAMALGLSVSAVAGHLVSRGSRSEGLVDSLHSWWVEMRRAAGPLMVDGAVYTVAAQGLVWILAAKSSVDQVGLYRVAVMIAFPLTVIQSGLSNPILQHLSALREREVTQKGRSMALLLAGVATAIAMASLPLLAPLNSFLLSPPELVSPLLGCLVLANAVLVFASEPLGRACIVENRVLQMAFWRAIFGAASFLFALCTAAGTSAVGVAFAVLAGQGMFTVTLWLVLRGIWPKTPHQGGLLHD